MKKVLVLSSVFFFSCTAVKEIDKEMSKIYVPPLRDVSKPIEEVKVSEVRFSDNLNHSVPDVKVNFTVKGNPIFLKEVGKYLKYPVKVEDEVAFNLIPPISLRGSLATVLEQIAVLTNSYWTHENGVVVFRKDKIKTYSIPFPDVGRVVAVYNSLLDDEEKIDMSRIKEDIFDEIEKSVSAVLYSQYYEGEIRREVEFVARRENKKEKGENLRVSGKKTKQTKESTEKSRSFEKTNVDSVSGTEMVNNRTEKKGKNGVKSEEVRSGKGKKSIVMPLIEDITDKSFKEEVQKGKSSDRRIQKQYAESENRMGVDGQEKIRQQENSKKTAVNTSVSSRIKETVNISKKIIKPKQIVAVSREAGIVIVRVTRETEREIDTVIKNVIEKNLKNLVILEVYVLETQFADTSEFSMELSALLRNKSEETNLSTGNGQLSIEFTSLSQDFLTGIAKGINLASVVRYITQKGKGKVLFAPNIVVLPGHIAEIKSAVKIPYLEPQTVSLGTTSAQQSYQIKGIDDGVALSVLPVVVGEDNVLISLSLKISRYVGDKTVSAGTLGTFSLPVESPRILTSTMRLKAGDVLILGGIRRQVAKVDRKRNFGIPEGDSKQIEKNTLLVMAKVKLLKFKEE